MDNFLLKIIYYFCSKIEDILIKKIKYGKNLVNLKIFKKLIYMRLIYCLIKRKKQADKMYL